MVIGSSEPLVSIMIPNYNHGKYLKQCIESALNQTYKNKEIILLDNQSTDHSLEIASKYISQGVKVCRNCYNILNASYTILARCLAKGKYMMILCADDYIESTFVSRAVEIMEKWPNVGYVHGEKDFVTDDGTVINLDPFYKCSFVAPGKNDSRVYLVTTVAHPSQGIVRKSVFEEVRGYDKHIDHASADKTLWFYMSQVSDYAYIREKMCFIRIGTESETFQTQINFQHPILSHLTIKDFIKSGKSSHNQKICEREQEALKKLSIEFLDYAAGMIMIENWKKANDFLQYCIVLSKDITENTGYQQLLKLTEEKRKDLELLSQFETVRKRKQRGYEPPEGYMELRR